MTKGQIIYILFFVLVFIDVGYSFFQHYNTPFDGDMAGGIIPAEDVKPVLENPLGVKAFDKKVTYPNPNRFFSHWMFYKYFNTIPLLLNNLISPLDSAYLACGISKTIIQFLILLILSIGISGKFNVFKLEFILAAFLITPLFQTNGYNGYMGIIDPSITYTFFYALPTMILLLYFTPLFIKIYYKKELKWFKYIKVIWIPLALVSSLSGPLNPGVSLIVSLLIFVNFIVRNLKNSDNRDRIDKVKLAFKKIPKEYYFFLLPICLFSVYSLFLGRYNSTDLDNEMPLLFLYSKLPEGIFYSFTQKIGFPVLFVLLIINSSIIRLKLDTKEGKKILIFFKWIGLFVLLYLLLLPLGGYRAYRPYILRYDTIIPVTISLIFIFGKTTIFILRNISRRNTYWYIPLLVLVIFIFTNSDKPEFDNNKCEREAISQIIESPDSIVHINNDCTILSWTTVQKPKKSELNAKLLKLWRVIDTKKHYYH